MQWIIIGSKGFIGSNVFHYLENRNYSVKGYDILSPDYYLDFYSCDFSEIVNDIPQTFLLCNSLFSARDEIFSTENLVREFHAYKNFYEILSGQNNNKKVIFMSSGGTVYGNQPGISISENSILSPVTPYGLAKALIENYLIFLTNTNNIKTIILRVSNAFGFGQRRYGVQGIIGTLKMCVESSTPFTLWNSGEEIRDYIWIEDVARAVEACVESKEIINIFNVGTGIGTKTKELIEIFEKISKKKIDVTTKNGIKTGIQKNVLDISKIIQSLSWKPLVKVEDGIKDILNNDYQMDIKK